MADAISTDELNRTATIEESVANSGDLGLTRFIVTLIMALCAVLTCLFILYHCRRRVQQPLCGVRSLLCADLILWTAGTLTARRSLWDAALPAMGSSDLFPDVQALCAMHKVLTHGVFEPAALAMVGMIFYAKSRANAAAPWRACHLLRAVLAVVLLTALAQMAFVLLAIQGSSAALGPLPVAAAPAARAVSSPSPPPPQPRSNDTSSSPSTAVPHPSPPSPPSPLPRADTATDTTQPPPWWRDEGCADTLGGVAVTCAFMIAFGSLWTIACARLHRATINHTMRWRVRQVQVLFTMVAVSLAVLRVLLLLVASTWRNTRRFLRDLELVTTLVASLATVYALIFRPVFEDRHHGITAGSSAGLIRRAATVCRIDKQGSANAMYDTVGAAERPGLIKSLEKRDLLTIAFLGHGALVGAANIIGFYDNYEVLAIGIAAVLGLSSAFWGLALLASGGVPDDTRPGFAHERSIMMYTSSYLAGVMWLCLRFSPLYPLSSELITSLDPVLCLITIAVYVYGLASPIATCANHWDDLTATEQLRMRGMVVSGVVGAVFILNTVALLLNGPAWWEHVLSLYPAQSVLEPSTALFAAYAVEAGMLLHRLARRGALTFAQVVPFYGAVVLPALTLLPMGCLFWWKHDDVSFWSFLFLGGGDA